VILPTRAALLVALGWLTVAIWDAFAGPKPALVAGLGLAYLGIGVVDALMLLGMPAPVGRRQAPNALSVGRWYDISLTLANDAPHPVVARVIDHHPATFDARDRPLRVTVPAHGWARLRYGLRSMRRGNFRFAHIEVRLRSRLGLFERRLYVAEPQDLRVYPDFGALAGYALLATDHHLSRLGVLQKRRRGEGMDFHQLREYRVGDSLRRIDWKATARMHRPISREYQDERDQVVVLLLDCGRRMTSVDGDLTHFDAALNAALLLAHVGLHHGDAVGAMTMAGEDRFVAPRKSPNTTNLLLNTLYDITPSLRTPDYYFAAVALMKRIRKRSLVVVLSNLRDEDDDTLLPALALMRRRHLVLFASLREAVLRDVLKARVHDLDSALTHAAAADYLQTRDASFRRLSQSGALVIDVEPSELPLALVNRYLDIKRTGTL
jgi:uncharacterized protein (DUF58 family)